MKTFTLEDIENAFDAGNTFGSHESYFDKPLDKEEYIKELLNPKIPEEKEIPITLGHIKASCGWSRYCDITGKNHYMLNEWSVEDTEIFRTKESHAKELNLI